MNKQNLELVSKVMEQNFSSKQFVQSFLRGKIDLKCKNKRQKDFVRLIDDNEITLCIGDSGVGKSYLSVIKSLQLFKTGNYDKIYIITPIVETEGESIGYLKGSLEDKLNPYLFSIYYIFDKIIGEDLRKKLIEHKVLETICISFLRGTNLDNCLVIADESQNITKKGILTLLTRIGHNSKFLISGDLNQIDRFKNPNDSGLKYAYENLQGVNNIGFIEFNKEDIVRNPIISDILDRFNMNNIS